MKRTQQLIGKEWITSREKRELDIVLALGIMPIALPLGGAAIGLSRLVDGRGVIFRQDRIDGNGDNIAISKIRTMRSTDEDTDGNPLKRVTWLGSKLRPLGIDEIPQLENILEGSMSVVGPRLLMTETITNMEAAVPRDIYEEWLDTYKRSKPGVISSFHISNRTGEYDEQAMKAKANMDIQDFRNASLRYDICLLKQAARIGISMLLNSRTPSQLAPREENT